MNLNETAFATKTYRSIRRIGDKEGSILLVPVGSLEQHGYHLPVATDSLLVEAVANSGADLVNETVPILVTPVSWIGFSPHHVSFGGTVSLGFETLRNTLFGIAETAVAHNFDAILFLNGHGGNEPLISATVSTVGDAFPSIQVLGLTYFRLAEPFIEDIRDSDIGGMAHAGEFETSLMLYLYPEYVDQEAIDATIQDEPYDDATQDLFVSGILSVYRDFSEYSESGAIGDAELATSEKGEEIFHQLGEQLEELLVAIHEQCTVD